MAAVLLIAVALGIAVVGLTRSGAPAPLPPVGAVPDAGIADPTSATSTPAPPAGVDVRSFGAVGDGVTDDAPAIRQALASADAVYVPAGTYLLASYVSPRPAVLGADFVFTLRSGQSIVAEPGAVFKMADGSITSSTAAWGGNVFLADRVQDVSVTGLTVDLNGTKNLVPPGRVITGYGLYLNAAQRVRLSGLTMRDTPGQNYIVAQSGGADIAVRDSTFHNGGTSLPGNENQNDFSALYFTATGVTVDRVTIDHDVQPFGYSGGVELHGSSESVTNSKISKSWPAVYIGPDTHSNLALMQNTTVAHNEFVDCGRGVVFNAGGVADIDKVDISRNIFRMVGFAAFPDEPSRGIDQDMPTDGRWTYHHVITNLSIASNDFYAEDRTADAVIRLSQVHSATIEQNKIHQAPGSVLVLGSSPWGTSDVVFRNNQISLVAAPSGPAVALALDGSSTIPPASAFPASSITIDGNLIELPEASPRACAVYANWPTGAPVKDIVVGDNSLLNIGLPTCGPQAGQLGGQ